MTLATALHRFRTCDRLASPPGTLSGTGHDLDARIARLTVPSRTSWPVRILILAVALTVVSTPLSLFLLPV